MPESNQAGRPELTQWIRATFLGWLLGLLATVALALLWDMVGGGAQFMIGLGMGAGVGYMQARFARQWLDSSRQWIWASMIGMTMPFLLWDVGAAVGVEFLFSLPLCAAIGGLLVGVLQRRVLRPYTARAAWWVPASFAGWALPVGAIAANDLNLVPGPTGEVLSVTAMLLGGVILGAVTGGTLVWMLGQPAV